MYNVETETKIMVPRTWSPLFCSAVDELKLETNLARGVEQARGAARHVWRPAQHTESNDLTQLCLHHSPSLNTINHGVRDDVALAGYCVLFRLSEDFLAFNVFKNSRPAG